jgi:branched-chain amino acid transport system ATP-binding protein
MPILKVDRVTLSFGGVTVLSNVSFDVEEKSICSIIGPNGAGKTSIVNSINGFYRPESGMAGPFSRSNFIQD